MDRLEEILSKVLAREEEKISNKITCYIRPKECVNCQPLCTHRRKQEERIAKLKRVRQIYALITELTSFKDELNNELNELEAELNIK